MMKGIKNNLKYNIGDKVTPDPHAIEVDTWLHECIGRTATVHTIGFGWFKVIFDDNGWTVTMPDEKWKQAGTHTTQEK
tara:strand:- start:73 stop:306 length:234 start_codon:yes stop_codon:yes gene_type:complete